MSRAELLDVIAVLERGRVRILAKRADEPGTCEVHGIVDGLREPGVDEKVGRVRRAYERLIDGTFNTCVDCGNTIGYQRLRLIPHSESCVPCAILASTD